MLRWLWVLTGIIVIGGVAVMATQPKGVPVDIAAAASATIREYVEEQAKTRLPDIQQVTMPLQGRILPISLREGDRVQAGQIVARMDDADLQTELVEQSNTVKRYDKNLEQIELTIQQAAQTVLASQAKYDFSERLFSRTKSLVDANSASLTKLEQDELQMTESQLDLRKEQLNKNIYVLMRGVVELMRESDVAKQAKTMRDRERTIIRSPVEGVVLSKEVSNEKVLSAGSVLMEIGDPDLLEVESEILTQDVAKIQAGDAVDIEGPVIGPRPVQGTVARIYPQGFTKVSSLGVEQQRVIVVVAFNEGVLDQLANAGRTLGIDYRVRIKIFTDEAKEAIVIPRAALFRGVSGQWQVFVVRDGKAVLTKIDVGLKNDYEVQVLNGVQVGEPVIVAPDSSLEDGMEVEAISSSA